MASIFQVAEYFLRKEPMTHKKLQKLCYYAQAWYLANYSKPLFPETFEAWVHGPVSPELYHVYRKWGWLSIQQNDSAVLNIEAKERSFLDRVFEIYGQYSGDELESITHQEEPWQKARRGYSSWEYCRTRISEDDMRDYYRQRIKV